MGRQHRNYLLDANGERIFDPAKGRYKLGKSIKTHDWDDSKRVQEWRAAWAEACNFQFRQHGIDKEVIFLSYAKQGIDREPTKHLGAKVRAEAYRPIVAAITAGSWLNASGKIGINKIETMLREPNCPFVLYMGPNKKLVKRKEFAEFISTSFVI